MAVEATDDHAAMQHFVPEIFPVSVLDILDGVQIIKS